ncbi:hypothetical protein B5F34_00655 [Mediterranea sp. An20]|nr:hypothetical protein B5F34_00655 [Mediterranea sp. An20]
MLFARCKDRHRRRKRLYPDYFYINLFYGFRPIPLRHALPARRQALLPLSSGGQPEIPLQPAGKPLAVRFQQLSNQRPTAWERFPAGCLAERTENAIAVKWVATSVIRIRFGKPGGVIFAAFFPPFFYGDGITNYL